MQVPVRHVARRQGARHNRDLSKPIFLTLTKLRTPLLNVSRNRAADEAEQLATRERGAFIGGRVVRGRGVVGGHTPEFRTAPCKRVGWLSARVERGLRPAVETGLRDRFLDALEAAADLLGVDLPRLGDELAGGGHVGGDVGVYVDVCVCRCL